MKQKEIQALLKQGYSVKRITKTLNCSASTVSYHRKLLGLYTGTNRTRNEDVDWSAAQEFYDGGATILETRRRFGISASVWRDGRSKGFIATKGRLTDDEIFVTESPYMKTERLRRKIIEDRGLRCEKCGIEDIYNDEPITLQVDHINGVSNDNRIENIRLLCPNCHSQTHTYAGKNIRNPMRVSKPYYKGA